MRNIFLLPTDKPSYFFISSETNEICRYFKKMDSKSNKIHIYITSDEQIKEGDWYYTNRFNIGIAKNEGDSKIERTTTSYKKIILTTDQDLINDGIQAIDDTFLEWFVKNPSCEFIKVERWVGKKIGVEFDANGHRPMDVFGDDYRITIPTETVSEEPKQETLEEAANRLFYTVGNEGISSIDSFIKGAKWQQEISYSEEEVGELVYNIIGEYGKHYGIMIDGAKLNDLFEQFKKK
jgi:hypothetical protein